MPSCLTWRVEILVSRSDNSFTLTWISSFLFSHFSFARPHPATTTQCRDFVSSSRWVHREHQYDGHVLSPAVGGGKAIRRNSATSPASRAHTWRYWWVISFFYVLLICTRSNVLSYLSKTEGGHQEKGVCSTTCSRWLRQFSAKRSVWNTSESHSNPCSATHYQQFSQIGSGQNSRMSRVSVQKSCHQFLHQILDGLWTKDWTCPLFCPYFVITIGRQNETTNFSNSFLLKACKTRTLARFCSTFLPTASMDLRGSRFVGVVCLQFKSCRVVTWLSNTPK